MKNEKKKKDSFFQFSKLLVAFSVIISIVGMYLILMAVLSYGLNEVVACSAITIFGGIAATSILFSLKKSQAENTIKIYLSAYEEIATFKKQNLEDTSDLMSEVENNLLGKVSNTLDIALDDATSPIERQETL